MPPDPAAPTELRLALPDEAATDALGRRLAGLARQGDVIALEGGLGAGKTTLARAFIRERARLAGQSIDEVPSPTFTLVQVYELPVPVFHFDLYRLNDEEEADELDLEDAFADGIALIEWPERIPGRLPAQRLAVGLTFAGVGRAATLKAANGGWGARLAHGLREGPEAQRAEARHG